MSLTYPEAQSLLQEMTETPSLLRHARCVELVMRALARHYGADEEQFAITGILHDADYDKYPEEHPQRIVARLRDMGETDIAHAIAGHYTRWNVPRESLLDKCIVAADELTGFVYAATLIRPQRLEGMDSRSVLKKFKTKSFAASVDREEVLQGAALLGWELTDLIDLIIGVFQENAAELDLLTPTSPA